MGGAISDLVRPLTTWAFVAAIIYMAVMQQDDTARAATVNLGIAVVSFWFGQRTAEKAAEALAGTGPGTGPTTVTSGGPTTVINPPPAAPTPNAP